MNDTWMAIFKGKIRFVGIVGEFTARGFKITSKNSFQEFLRSIFETQPIYVSNTIQKRHTQNRGVSRRQQTNFRVTHYVFVPQLRCDTKYWQRNEDIRYQMRRGWPLAMRVHWSNNEIMVIALTWPTTICFFVEFIQIDPESNGVMRTIEWHPTISV